MNRVTEFVFLVFAYWSKALQSHVTVSVETVEQRDRDKFPHVVSLPLFTSKHVWGAKQSLKLFDYVETNTSVLGFF